MDKKLLRAQLEALLFVCEDPQNVARLAESIPEATREEVQEALDALMAEYTDERFGIQLAEIAGGFQLSTKAAYAECINRHFEKRRKRTLSKASLETLAIIAYKQPLTRAEMEAIRGVSVEGALHGLLERRLVKISGRKEIPGRPFLYRTTKSFLHYFGLKSLDDLPKVDDIVHGLKDPGGDPDSQLWDDSAEDSAAEANPD